MDSATTGTDVSTGSSPAPSTPPPSGQAVLDSMSQAERTQWELTGDLPTPTTTAASSAESTSAASSPATPAEQAASTDATETPASEPGTPQKNNGHRGNAETRVQELLASERRHREEIARLQGQLDVLSRGPAKADGAPGSSPEQPTTQADWERFARMSEAPQEAEFEHFRDYAAAMSLFVTDKRIAEHLGRAQRDADMRSQVTAVEQMATTATARIQDHVKSHADFNTKVDAALLEIPTASVRRLQGQPVGPQHVLAEEVLKSEHVAPLLEHFSTDAGKAEWGRLCALAPGDLLRAFGRLEGRFEGAAGTPASPKAPEPKTLSTAPAPSTHLGSRPTEPLDPSDAALKRKDFAAYAAAENAKATAGVGAR